MSKEFEKFKQKIVEFDQDAHLTEANEYLIQLCIMFDEFMSSPEYDTMVERMMEMSADKRMELVHLHHYLNTVGYASQYLLNNVEWFGRLKEMRNERS